MTEPEVVRRETPHQAELRLSEELERIGGVLAAAVRLGKDCEVRDVYIAAAEGADADPLKEAATDALKRAGFKAAASAVRVAAVPAGAASGPTTAPSPAAAAAPRPKAGSSPAPASGTTTTTTTPLEPWQGRFLILRGVEAQSSAGRVGCQVRLERLDESFEGQADEVDTELGRARAGARAALAAAEKASPSALGLEGIQIPDMFGRRYVVVAVEASAARRYAMLSGIVSLEGARSLEEAAALAALRAIERFISW